MRGPVIGAEVNPHELPDSTVHALSNTAALRGVLRSTPYRRLWYTTALSSLGDWLGLLATTALATNLAHGYRAQNYALGGVLVVRLLPAIVLGPLAGAFADRFDRRRTMVITDFVRFLIFVSIPLAYLVVSQRQALIWLIVASFVIECVSLFWMPAKDASVPNLVRRDQIEAANQLSLITTYGLTPVGGAGLFSLFALITNVLARHFSYFTTHNVDLALYFNAVTFLVGAIVVIFIREIGGSRAISSSTGEQPRLLTMLREGAAFVRHSRLVGGLIVGLVGAFVAAGAVIGAGKTFVASLGGGDAAYGTLFGAVFVGLGSGIALGPRVARDMSRRRLFGAALVFAAVCLMAVAVMPQVVLAIVFVVGIGFGAGVAYLSGTTLLGTDVDDVMRGRVFALLQSMIRIVLVLALAAVPFAVAGVGRTTLTVGSVHYIVDGTRIVLLVGGALALVCGIVAYRKMDQREHLSLWADLKVSMRGDSAARRRMRNAGLFVAFEGGEGSGKSTQIARLAATLRASGLEVVVTHEPGGTEAGGRIRDLLLHGGSLSARAEALLFAADRADHVDTVIRPALEARKIVLTDRYVDSSLAYQGAGRKLRIDEVRKVSRWATQGLKPDLTVVLDVPAEIGLQRARGAAGGDRLESESLAFHDQIRRAFLALAEADPRHHTVIDARLPEDEVAARVRTATAALLGARAARLLHTPASSDAQPATAGQP